jgi:NIMA (never in mitosis gene a)-related kinase 1/4/5
MNKLSEKERENALNEVRILASIWSPQVLGYRDSFFEEDSNTLCLVMEYADQGDLQQRLDSLRQREELMPEAEIWNVVIKVLLALKVLHRSGIVHRDIKAANIFLSSNGEAGQEVKLGDMNVSKVARQGLMNTQTGTPYYASPEVW